MSDRDDPDSPIPQGSEGSECRKEGQGSQLEEREVASVYCVASRASHLGAHHFVRQLPETGVISPFHK